MTVESLEPGKTLSAAQVKTVLSLIDPKKIQVRETDELLYVKNARGEDERVDAINYPDRREIVLFAPAWREHIRYGFELKHLVLHELLGLARIDDAGYKISAKIFPPSRRPVSLTDGLAKCYASMWVLYFDAEGVSRIRQAFPAQGQSFEKTFGAAERRGGKKSSVCGLNGCRDKDYGRLVRSLDLRVPLKLDTEAPDAKTYFIEIASALEGESFLFGWGAASRLLVYNPPLASWIVSVSTNGKVATMAEGTILGSNDSGRVTFGVQLPDPSFHQALRESGIRLEIAPKVHREVGQGILDIHNVWELLRSHAVSKGAAEGEVDRYLRENVFKSFGEAVPITTAVTCTFYPEQNKR